jgi:hypothetical protein
MKVMGTSGFFMLIVIGLAILAPQRAFAQG